jgi:uncharacterized protein
MLKTYDEIMEIHKKYAPTDEVYDLVFTHCCIVRDIAMQLIDANDFDIDYEIIEKGALLHDIGVYSLFDNTGKLWDGAQYITHGIEGEHILKEEGFPEYIWRFASHHTGAGLSKQDVIDQKLPLPIADYFAETDEELLIMYADKFHSKTNPPYFNSFDWYRKDIAKFGDHKVAKFDCMAVRFGKPDLLSLSSIYSYAIR